MEAASPRVSEALKPSSGPCERQVYCAPHRDPGPSSAVSFMGMKSWDVCAVLCMEGGGENAQKRTDLTPGSMVPTGQWEDQDMEQIKAPKNSHLLSGQVLGRGVWEHVGGVESLLEGLRDRTRTRRGKPGAQVQKLRQEAFPLRVMPVQCSAGNDGHPNLGSWHLPPCLTLVPAPPGWMVPVQFDCAGGWSMHSRMLDPPPTARSSHPPITPKSQS